MHFSLRLASLCSFMIAGFLVATAPAYAVQMDGDFTKGLLWRVEKRGASPSYLFGTLHHDDERVTRLPAPVQRAFAKSTQFAVELISDEDSIRKYRLSMMRREPLLSALVGEEAWSRYDELLATHGMPRDARSHLKPWAAMLILVRPQESPGIILDHLLLMDAQKRGKTIVALETIDEQIAAMNDLPEDTQVALLRHAEESYDRVQQSFKPLLQAYLARDLDRMWQINEDMMSGGRAMEIHNTRFINSLLYQRNERFADRLKPLIDKGACFAAFGSLHLYGPRGVLALLEERGYRVSRVY